MLISFLFTLFVTEHFYHAIDVVHCRIPVLYRLHIWMTIIYGFNCSKFSFHKASIFLGWISVFKFVRHQIHWRDVRYTLTASYDTVQNVRTTRRALLRHTVVIDIDICASCFLLRYIDGKLSLLKVKAMCVDLSSLALIVHFLITSVFYWCYFASPLKRSLV